MAFSPKNILAKASHAVVPTKLRKQLLNTRLRVLFVDSNISNEGRVARWWRKTVTHEKPTLMHLDVHVADHCNLKCKGCEHYSSIADKSLCDPEVVLADLKRLSELFANIDQIWLLGGEPLLHPEIAKFIYGTRETFPETRLSVMTNGILVTRMSEEFWQAMKECDAALLCDDYPINIDKEAIEALCVQHGIELTWMPPAEEFFKIPLDVTGSANPKLSFARCRNLSNCAIVRDGYMYPCAHVAYADIPAEKFNLPSIKPTEHDAISLYEGATGDDIIHFLMTPVPWCKHCDFDSFTTYTWSQSSGDASEWIKEPHEHR